MKGALYEVARLLGVQADFRNDRKELVRARPEQLQAAINVFHDGPAGNEAFLRDLARFLRRNHVERALPPALVAWDGDFSGFWLRLPGKAWQGKAKASLAGCERVLDLARLPAARTVLCEGESYASSFVSWKIPLTQGYHALELEHAGVSRSCLVISAPLRIPLAAQRQGSWGVFTPVYSLRGKPDSGIGGFRELEAAQAFLAEQGGGFLGTLPFLSPVDHDSPEGISPYSTGTRLFWNEIFLDLPSLGPEQSRDVPPTAPPADVSLLVDYQGVFQGKKAVLRALSQEFFSRGIPQRDPEYRAFLAANPQLEAYAAFCSREPGEREYHFYVQYQCHRALSANKRRADRGELSPLYLDFPIGISPSGFDCRQFPEVFLHRAALGAPPDSAYTAGQNWNTVPFHPAGIRSRNYRYFIDCLRGHFRYARLLRLDHIMGYSRIYAIPRGLDAASGVYLRFPAEELHAILCLEAAAAGAELIGENLGTVPEAVSARMDRHGIQKMWVFGLECMGNPEESLQKIPAQALVALNTHDMEPFAALWRRLAKDGPAAVGAWRDALGAGPEEQAQEVLARLLGRLALTPARHLMVNLEDLWGETRQQNVPGSYSPRNWRARHRQAMAEWEKDPFVLATFAALRKARER